METPLLPILVPGLAGLLLLLLPDRVRGARPAIGVLAAAATLFVAAALPGTTGRLDLGAIALGPLDLAFVLEVGTWTGWLVPFVALLSLLASIYAAGFYAGRGGAPGRFYAYVLLATAGAAGVLLAGHLLFLVLFWEVVTLSLFLLVATGRPDGAGAAAKAMTILGAGDMALLTGIVLIGVSGAPLSLDALAAAPFSTAGALPATVFLLLAAGAAAKAGAIPLHSWLPTMSTAADAPVMALLPAALDKVLGIYLLVRVVTDLAPPGPGLRTVLMAVGAITILAAVLMAMVQHDLRRLLSFHAVSQVGYMFLGIGTGTVAGIAGGVFHMVNNAVYKPCLFLGAGVVERGAGTTDLSRLGGLAKAMPVSLGAMFVASLAIAGVPPLNGFASKWLVYRACLDAGQPLFLAVALFGSALTLASFVKVLHSVFFGPRPAALDGAREEGFATRVPLVVLAGLCVLLGVLAALPLDAVAGPAAKAASGAALLTGADAVYRPIVLTAMLIVGAFAGLALARTYGSGARRVRPVFMGGEPVNRETNRFPGPEFYRTVTDLPGLGAALEAGEKGRFDLYRILAGLGGRAIAALRALHTGRLVDYLAFCLAGLVFLVILLSGG